MVSARASLDHVVLIAPRRVTDLPLTSNRSAKSLRIAISRLKHTSSEPWLVISRSSCIPPSIRRARASPRVFSGMVPRAVEIFGFTQKTLAEFPDSPPPFNSFQGTPSAKMVQTQISRVSRKKSPFWPRSGI